MSFGCHYARITFYAIFNPDYSVPVVEDKTFYKHPG